MKTYVQSCPRLQRRAVKLLTHTALVALVLAVTLPVRAADQRAVKSRVSPSYPEIAKRLNISGVVVVEATVDPAGKVTDVKTVTGNRMLSPAAEDAVKRWKFEPGTAVDTVDVDINFVASGQ